MAMSRTCLGVWRENGEDRVFSRIKLGRKEMKERRLAHCVYEKLNMWKADCEEK